MAFRRRRASASLPPQSPVAGPRWPERSWRGAGSGVAAATTVSAGASVFSVAVAAGCAAAGGSPSFSVCVRIGTGSCAAGNCREAGPVSTGFFSGPSSTQGISHTAIATSTAAPTSRSFKPWSMWRVGQPNGRMRSIAEAPRSRRLP